MLNNLKRSYPKLDSDWNRRKIKNEVPWLLTQCCFWFNHLRPSKVTQLMMIYISQWPKYSDLKPWCNFHDHLILQMTWIIQISKEGSQESQESHQEHRSGVRKVFLFSTMLWNLRIVLSIISQSKWSSRVFLTLLFCNPSTTKQLPVCRIVSLLRSIWKSSVCFI